MTVHDPSALLDGLDVSQHEAVVELRGPVRILAGAGAGKTRTITHRIAYGVATGTYAPDRVLALTFTSKAAAELRTRLRLLGAQGVQARTFHAAALSQLNYFWPNAVGGRLPELVDNKARVIGHAAAKCGFKLNTATIRDVASAIELRKVSGIPIEQIGNGGITIPSELTIDQLSELMTAYDSLKDDRRQMDFEDVITLCVGMIAREASVAFHIREKFRFFIVDEYQDVSPIQQALLDVWLGDRRDLCVVGDASQTIYSFTGATSDFLLGFGSRYVDAHLIDLHTNYRSTPQISEFANTLMKDRQGALVLRAPDWAESGTRPVINVSPSDSSEARSVAAEISRRIARGATADQFAILYRVNAQSGEFETALADAGISTVVHGAIRFFDRQEVRQAMMAIRGAAVAGTSEPLFKVVSDVLRGLGWTQSAPESGGAVRDRWEVLNMIIEIADRMPANTTVMQFADELLERQRTGHEPTPCAVTLATIHSVKGLEWDEVFVVGLSEGLLPISYARDVKAVDEERRLLYVAITRARRSLSLSWAMTGSRNGELRVRSRFLDDLDTRNARSTSVQADQ